MADDERTTGKGDADASPFAGFGEYLRNQRQTARLSLRQLADMARVSNPYLSQIERGLHQPSIKVVTSLAEALNVSADALLRQAAGLAGEAAPSATELAVRGDARLSASDKETLLTVYRSLLDRSSTEPAAPPVKATPPTRAAVKKAAATKAAPTKAAPTKAAVKKAPAKKAGR